MSKQDECKYNFTKKRKNITKTLVFLENIMEILFLSGTGCGRPLGMVSGEIRDFQISYSSDTADYMYDQGRLLLPGPGWCASADDDKPYFQVTVCADRFSTACAINLKLTSSSFPFYDIKYTA